MNPTRTAIFFLLLCCAASVPLARAQAPAAAPKSQADLDYESAWASYRVEMPATIKESPKESFKWNDRKFQDFAAAVRAFGEKHPDDPRRYDGWVQSSYTGPSFIVNFKPEFDTRPSWGALSRMTPRSSPAGPSRCGCWSSCSWRTMPRPASARVRSTPM